MKSYLLVGGSKGIGMALAQILLQQGHSVHMVSRSNEQVDLSVVHHIKGDILGIEEVDLNLPDKLDGLVYLPGSINLRPFRSLKISDFQRDWEINVVGAIKSIKIAEKKLKKSEIASVVLFSTVAVQQGMAFHASVAASKGAIEGLTRSLAAEYAPKIRFNCIAPSLTDTPLAARILSNEDKRLAADKRHPLRRIGQPEDIAQMAAFLLSKESSWVTGQIIGVDGGLSSIRI